jgi:hypothetical protein
MDALNCRSLFGLNTDQLLVELNILPESDLLVEAKSTDCQIECLSPGVNTWLNGPVFSACEIAGGI